MQLVRTRINLYVRLNLLLLSTIFTCKFALARSPTTPRQSATKTDINTLCQHSTIQTNKLLAFVLIGLVLFALRVGRKVGAGVKQNLVSVGISWQMVFLIQSKPLLTRAGTSGKSVGSTPVPPAPKLVTPT